jgi:hypothetical protein
MKQLFVTITFAISLGFILGRLNNLFIPWLNFTAQKGDLTTFIQWSLIAAITALILGINIKKRKANHRVDWASWIRKSAKVR